MTGLNLWCAILSIFSSAAAFTLNPPRTTINRPSSARALFPEASQVIATIDSDIASIPDNEFSTIFAGGILVMLGGLLSALFVGSVVDHKDLYASIVADSYAQSAEDEEFWKGLSDEEKKKAQEMLDKIKASKSGGEAPKPAVAVSSEESREPIVPEAKSAATEAKKTVGMFSDYGED